VTETPKERSNRQLGELLQELRVVLPGTQVLLPFLLAVPCASRFERTPDRDRWALYVCLVLTSVGIVLLLAPTLYHRLRWERGGKQFVVAVGHRLFVAGTFFLGLGLLSALFLVADVLAGEAAAGATTAAIGAMLAAVWYVLPFWLGRSDRFEEAE